MSQVNILLIGAVIFAGASGYIAGRVRNGKTALTGSSLAMAVGGGLLVMSDVSEGDLWLSLGCMVISFVVLIVVGTIIAHSKIQKRRSPRHRHEHLN